ncbi:MAG: S8 family serine peptidase, partial [Mycobacteriales bacterium]
RVASALRAAGFDVTEQTTWTVTATGTAGEAARTFATTLRRTAAGVKPVVPPRAPREIASDVTAVLGLDTRRAFRAHAVPDGFGPDDIRRAYAIPTATGGSGQTVATVQFDGWRRTDLASYAAGAFGIAPSIGPDGTGAQIQEVSVSGKLPSEIEAGGDVEVALDQESIFAAAPAARQRIYFAPNTTAAAVDAFTAIDSQVVANGITAVSTSWGGCESQVSEPERTAIDNVLASILARGASIFAASGDAGRYDCADFYDGTNPEVFSITDVDYPASSPFVLGVGGTALYLQDGTPREVAWNDPDDADPSIGYRGSGSGGGESQAYPKPSWQAGLPGTGRLVPDIAAEADPFAPGSLGLFITAHRGWTFGGGTSMSAPLMAGGLAATLSEFALAGQGDLHPFFYANPGAFRDVTQTEQATELVAFPATPGYDLSTGLGSPVWRSLGQLMRAQPGLDIPPYTHTPSSVPVRITVPTSVAPTGYAVGVGVTCDSPTQPGPPTSIAMPGPDRATTVTLAVHDATTCYLANAPIIIDTAAPVARATLAYAPHTLSQVVPSWSHVDAGASSGLYYYEVRLRRVGASTPLIDTLTRRTTPPSPTAGVAGSTYVLEVVAEDNAGNRSALTTAILAVPYDDRTFSFSPRAWTRQSSASAYGGSHVVSTTKGSYVTHGYQGRSYDLVFTATSRSGYVDVYVNGVRTGSVNTYSPTTTYRKIVHIYGSRSAPDAVRTLKLVVRGVHQTGSSGNYVYLDAIRVTH